MTTFLTSLTTSQATMFSFILSFITFEDATPFYSFFKNGSQLKCIKAPQNKRTALSLLEEYIGKELVSSARSLASNSTLEQTVHNILCSLTPQQIHMVAQAVPEVQTMLDLFSRITPEQVETMLDLFSRITPEQVQTMLKLVSSVDPEDMQTMLNLFFGVNPEQVQTMLDLFSRITPEQVQTMLDLVSRITPQNEVGNVGRCVRTNNSGSQGQMRNDVAHTIATLISNFVQSQSSSTVQPETPSREAVKSQFDFSSIRNRVHTFFDTDNKPKQDQPQESTQNSQRVSDAPQSQFDFSAVRNLAHTLFDSNNSANQDKPQERKEDSQRRSDAPQPEFDFSSIRNLVHTFFDTDNSANQDEPQDTKENSQQKRKDYRDDLDLD